MKFTLALPTAFTRWNAYRRAYTGGWQGFLVPRLRRGLYDRAAHQLAVASPQNAHILDVGAGPGHLLVAIARQLPNASLRGIDIIPHMTDEARRVIESAGLTDRITIQQADAAALPFDDSTFDCVVSMMSYHLWDDQPAGLAEARRVLKPGGPLHLYVGRWEAYPGRLPVLDYFNHTSGTTLVAALRSAGFVTVDVSYPRRQGTYLFASARRPPLPVGACPEAPEGRVGVREKPTHTPAPVPPLPVGEGWGEGPRPRATRPRHGRKQPNPDMVQSIWPLPACGTAHPLDVR